MPRAPAGTTAPDDHGFEDEQGYRHDETRREFIDLFTGQVYRRGIRGMSTTIPGQETREQKKEALMKCDNLL